MPTAVRDVRSQGQRSHEYARYDQALSRHVPRKITSWILFRCGNNCRVRSMDWFEKITGFQETSYEDTRAKLKTKASQLQSLINGKRYSIGELELVSLQTLREKAKSAGGLPGRLKVGVVIGDVRQMHQSPENAGALFQVASQFNLLEMGLAHGDPRAGRYPLPTRSYSRPSVCDRRRCGHDLP